jgi:hypothetical protein
LSNPFTIHGRNLSQIFIEVGDSFAAQGRPLPTPPDLEDEELDRAFWTEVWSRLTPAEREWLQMRKPLV